VKVNGPVTGVERMLSPGRPVVTKTDLKGVVTYCNQAYIDISGFSREEAIGHSQNLVRHPDVPPEVFADLWRTIEAEHPWCGVVKNRSKNGDHYWVKAYVTPIYESGKCIDYMSVRTEATRSEVEAAESLFKDINAKRRSFPATKIGRGGQWIKPAIIGGGFGVALLSALGGALSGVYGVVAGGVGAFLALAFSWAAYQQMVSRSQELETAIERMDEGRVDIPIVSPGGAMDGVFSRMEGLRIHLKAMFADVFVSVADVAERSDNLDKSMRNIVAALETQNESVMQVSAAMEQMSVAISEISKGTEVSLSAARKAEEVANVGMSAMSSCIDSNQEAAMVVSKAAQQMSDVNSAIHKIDAISQIIRDIADQTNLLALNAAIEAARAGEQGRGVAVVADEVRKLAERTACSTVEIAAAVESIVSQSHLAVSTMDDARVKVYEGTSRVEESSSSLQAISSASKDAVSVSSDITEMLRQQSVSSHEVANNMERVSVAIDTSHETLRRVEEATSGLRNTVNELHLLLRHMERSVMD